MVGSMGRVGAAGTHAAMEAFWSLLQTNVLNQQRWATRYELRLAIVVWIERNTTANAPRTPSAACAHRVRSQATPSAANPRSLNEPVTTSLLTPPFAP